jgi:hypothetical protein
MVNPELRKHIPPLTNKDNIFTKMSLLFIETYEALERALKLIDYKNQTQEYIEYRQKYTNEFPMRYLEIMKEYQEQLFA